MVSQIILLDVLLYIVQVAEGGGPVEEELMVITVQIIQVVTAVVLVVEVKVIMDL